MGRAAANPSLSGERWIYTVNRMQVQQMVTYGDQHPVTVSFTLAIL